MIAVEVLKRLAPFWVAILVLGLVIGGAFPAAAPGSQASPSQDPSARCELTPDGTAVVTIDAKGKVFGSPVTIEAGQAVAFQNVDTTAHTVTEGVAGHAADNACARKRLAPHAATVVTFHLPGDYRFTCTIHPSMQTTVHVR